MKIAIVHDYLFQFGGAEKVIETWLEMYPDADIYTSFFVPNKFSSSENITRSHKQNKIHTSLAQYIFRFNFFQRFQKHFFWLYPIAIRLITVKDYDLVLISTTDCGKQIKLQNNKKIIHYCHSPTRYLHGLITEADHKSLNLAYRLLIPILVPFLKYLDLNAVLRLNKQNTIWLANSNFIKETILKVYDTQSTVVYPPIELDKFLSLKRSGDGDFYLCHGRISFHKRLDLAILACLKLGKKLKISGTSGFTKQMDDLQKIVDDFEKENPEKTGLIEFLGRTSDETYFDLLDHCKGLLFPGKEDFGIAPVEILASGVPLIAYKAGGALEYVKNGENGIFFENQTVDSLSEAILSFEKQENWNINIIKESSKSFSKEIFIEKMNSICKN